ncbi:MAG: quinone-dependent dihydroorotate dehydrogenase [Acetobacteraceae bacterium]
MAGLLSSLAQPLLRRIDPERAHRLALIGLRTGLAGADRTPDDAALVIETLGLRFHNPIGLAAGFDKNAVAIRNLARFGFGFVEVGTFTPRAQPGNVSPRLFRLTEDRAVINRMGFNGAGLAAILPRLTRARLCGVPVGANIGINKDDADPERDYPASLNAVGPWVDYAVVNLSSPNTPGLRDLQRQARLRSLLAAIAAQVPRRPPLLIKISPDLATDDLSGLVETCITGGVEGLIVSNTTLSRPPSLRSAARTEAGGLSGAPLFRLSTAILARARLLARGRLVLIGVGGVFTGQDVLTKLQAGASLVQIYTSFAYGGPAVVPRIKHELAAALGAAGFACAADAIGTDAEHLAGLA